MDLIRPVEALIPGAQGRLLGVLARTDRWLNLRTLADLAKVHPSQASRVLPRLGKLGVVERTEAPPSALFRLHRGSLVGGLVIELAQIRTALLREMQESASALAHPPPTNVTVFGSLTRHEASAESDLDVLFVRPMSVAEDDDAWIEGLQSWVALTEERAGNSVNIIEASEAEIAELLTSGRPPWNAMRRDGVVLTGRTLEELAGHDA